MLMRLKVLLPVGHPSIGPCVCTTGSTAVSGGTKYNYPAGHLGLTSTIAPTLTAL